MTTARTCGESTARYLKGWEASAEGINTVVGVLRTTIAKRAIQCVMAELPAGKGSGLLGNAAFQCLDQFSPLLLCGTS